MRVVVLSSSVYSETACAVTAEIAGAGHTVAGALSLRTLDYKTLLRKLAQWGPAEFAQYARAKLVSRSCNRSELLNPYLAPFVSRSGSHFGNLRQLGAACAFPIETCTNQNSKPALITLRKWRPDVIVFAGGNILKEPLLQIPRLGVINLHLGLLPQIRGMSSPEWSLLTGVPIGITIHYMDSGIDTGRILLRRNFPEAAQCQSLQDLRNRLIAFGVNQFAEVLHNLERGAIVPQAQPQLDRDNQFFVMHDRLRGVAADRLAAIRSSRCVEVA